MSEILIPGQEKAQENEKPVDMEYQATEEDEERFFLMYHLNFQPSEAERLSSKYRKWIISRFVAQKHMERESIERHRLMQQLQPNLKVSG